MRRFMFVLLFVAVCLLLPAAARAADCGYEPTPPAPPAGCMEVDLVCVCNASGTRCWWQAECVEEMDEDEEDDDE